MNSSNQHPNPVDDDWRLQTTAHLSEDWLNPWTGQNVPKGSRITVVSIIKLTTKKQLTIPLPNASALLLNSSALAFFTAQKIRTENGIDKSLKTEISFSSDKDAFDYVERMIEAIVLAFTALEAFINESIPEDFVYSRFSRSDLILEASNKANIERHVKIDEKLTTVLPEILNCSSPKGSQYWSKYKHLKQTRDRLIHMKTDDRKSSITELDTVWKAIFLTSAPHITVMEIIGHFVKAMSTEPGWYSKFPHK